MLDAVAHSIDQGRGEEAKGILASALERHRATIRELRDLSFALEPVVLRDHGFRPALEALAEQVGTSHRLRIDLDIDAAEDLGETAHVALYTIVRELLELSIRRGPPSRIEVVISRTGDGGVEACVSDDAEPERRRRSFEAIEERVTQLHGRIAVEPGKQDGTLVRVTLPPYTATR